MIVNLKSIKHISFDVWLTLIRSHHAFKPARNQLFRTFFGITESQAFVEETIIYFDRLCDEINQITGGQIEWKEMVLMILKHLKVDILEVDNAMLAAYYQEMELIFWKYPPVLVTDNLPNALSIAKQKGFSLSLLSNTGFIEGATLRQYWEQKNLATYFDFQLYSDELHYSKPNAKVFESVLQAVLTSKQVEKHQILHVGDNRIADNNAASDYGFTGFHINDISSFLRELTLFCLNT